MPGIARADEHAANVFGSAMARKIRHGEYVPDERGETVIEYAERWTADRERKGLASVNEDRRSIRNYVAESFGARPIEAVKADQLRAFVAELDAKVQAGDIKAKTALNVWGVVRKMFTDATESKIDALRVLSANPAAGVKGPDRALEKTRKQYLYPSEFLALVTSDAVPVWRARVYALSAYLWTRPGELAALTWSEVDLEHRIVRIHESIDRQRTGKRKTTKTAMERIVPIEEPLVPLLEAMRAESSGRGLVCPRLPRVDGEYGLAGLLRRDLAAAGVVRVDLFRASVTRKAMTFYDLRATGITWAAVRGDAPLEIQQRAGHTMFTTTQGYIREASPYRRPGVVFGTVFGPLPDRLLSLEGPENESYRNRTIVPGNPQISGDFVGAAGFEPADFNRESARKSASIREARLPNRTSRRRSLTALAGADRVEVDGRVLARVERLPGEPLDHAEARLRLAVEQRGGLRRASKE